ncbi:MAG: SUMF1/EgtB/PvdO family nonheme iron enzyme [Alphaproteobacteria bacterium]|nr:SUMF1/EgtB/PvdO family nonheme iron enzyme [Alphaproteobacteria bacterium]
MPELSFAPEDSESLQSLGRAMRRARGFRLLFLTVTPSSRGDALAWIREQARQLNQTVLPDGEAGIAELKRWLDRLMGVDMPEEGVILPDGGALLRRPDVLWALNGARDTLGARLRGPLTIVLTPDELAQIGRTAYDLYDTRSGSFHVEGPRRAPAPDPLEGEMSRLRALEDRAEPPPPHALAEAWLRLSRELLAAERWEDALDASAAAEPHASRVGFDRGRAQALLVRAVAYVETGRLGEAEQALRVVEELGECLGPNEEAEVKALRARLKVDDESSEISMSRPSWDVLLLHHPAELATAVEVAQEMAEAHLELVDFVHADDLDRAVGAWVLLCPREHEVPELLCALLPGDPQPRRVVLPWRDRELRHELANEERVELSHPLDEISRADLGTLARSIREQRVGSRAIEVEVLAVRAELAEAQDAVAARLRRMLGVAAVHVVDAARVGEGPRVDLSVVLLGGRTAGTSVLAETLERHAVVALKTERLDFARLVPVELERAAALQARVKTIFSTPEEAADRVLSAVGEWMRGRARAGAAQAPVVYEAERAMLLRELPGWLSGRYSYRVAESWGVRLEREALYVPLNAMLEDAYERRGQITVRVDLEEQGEPDLQRWQDVEPVSLERALCEPSLRTCVVVGEPGAGKTVLLQHVAAVLACVHLARPVPEHLLDLTRLSNGAPLPPIPVFLEARQLVGGLGDLGGDPVREFVRLIQRAVGVTFDESVLRKGLCSGRYLLLVDALDEVAEQATRERLFRALEAVASRSSNLRLVVSTRPGGAGAIHFGGLPVLHVAALDGAMARRVLHRWCVAQGHDLTREQELAAALLGELAKLGRAPFSKNPLLLTSAILVSQRERRLPVATATLHEALVALLCQARRTLWPDGVVMSTVHKRQALEVLSYAMQVNGGAAMPAMGASAELQRWLPARLSTDMAAIRLLEDLAMSTGLLRMESGDPSGPVVRPWHRSLQEYLAALHVAGHGETEREMFFNLLNRGEALDPAWEGVMRFMVGVLGARGSAQARAWVEALREQTGSHVGRRRGHLCALLTSALAEYGEDLEGLPWREAWPAELVEVYEREGQEWGLQDRLLALESLGALGDPRLGDPRHDDSMWVDIPGGEFTLGMDQQAPGVRPPRVVEVRPFLIAWRPVTVHDYALFLSETSHGPPVDWSRQLLHPNRPVVSVTWFEAMDFCAWATQEWRHPEGWSVSLPSEEQREYLAAGPGGARYPWGEQPPGAGDDALANYRGALPGQHLSPTPVGAFPGGSRVWGGRRLVDLAGNVDEWCLNEGDGDALSSRSERDSGFADETRVVRGGAWIDWSWSLRCGGRARRRAESRAEFIGFRAALVRVGEP